MPFDGTGRFIRLHDWTTDAAAGIAIDPARWDEEEDDFAAGMSQVVTKDGQSPAYANIPMADVSGTGHIFTTVAAASATNHYAQVAQLQDGKYHWCGFSDGTPNAITLTAPTLSAATVATGETLLFRAHATNSGPMTANVNGTGAVAIVHADELSAQLMLVSSDQVIAGGLYWLRYDGTFYVLTRGVSAGARAVYGAAPGSTGRTFNFGSSTSPNIRKGTLSFWMEGGATASMTAVAGTNMRFNKTGMFWRLTNGGDRLGFTLSVGATGTSIFFDSTVNSSAPSRHYIISYNSSNTATCQMFVNDVDESTAGWCTVGADTTSDGSLLMRFSVHCRLAEIYYDDKYYNLADTNVRRKFITDSGKPADLGSNGSRPSGARPRLYLPDGNNNLGTIGTATGTAFATATDGFASATAQSSWNWRKRYVDSVLTDKSKLATFPDSGGSGRSVLGNSGKTVGKWYAEIVVGGGITGSTAEKIGIVPITSDTSVALSVQTLYYIVVGNGAFDSAGGGGSDAVDAWLDNDVINVAYDGDNNKVWFGLNGVYGSSGNPSAGTGAAFNTTASTYFLGASFGFSGQTATIRTTAAEFSHAIPTGFSAWG